MSFGAQNQNGVAERNIKSITFWAQSHLHHSSYHWPKRTPVHFWPASIQNAVCIFNNFPAVDTGVLPNEVWSQTKSSIDNFQQAHVWGCLAYVLEAELQDGKKIPKRDPRERLEMFVGFSPIYSSLVPLVLNVRTGKISQHYHVVFEDECLTVNSLPPIKYLGL